MSETEYLLLDEDEEVKNENLQETSSVVRFDDYLDDL